MNMPRGPRRLFKLIEKFVARYGAWGFFASQRWIAGKLGCSIRTVKRWTHFLIFEAKRIATRRRSQDTCVYNVLAPQMAPQMAPRIKEESATQIGSLPERKPAARQEMPPYEIQHEGRMVINPEYQLVREALLRADDRIRRARNPNAYARAIIARVRVSA